MLNIYSKHKKCLESAHIIKTATKTRLTAALLAVRDPIDDRARRRVRLLLRLNKLDCSRNSMIENFATYTLSPLTT